MRYTINFKLKHDINTINYTFTNKDCLYLAIKQIYRWFFVIDWKIYKNTFDDFEYLKIIEKNYSFINWLNEYLLINDDSKWDVDIDIISKPYTKDITNYVLNTILVWNIYHNIELTDNNLYINWENFVLKNNSKWRDIFKILVDIRKSQKINFISYEFILNHLMNNSENYPLIKSKDINLIIIRNTLKNKLSEIKKRLWKDIIKILVDWIHFL